MKRGEELPVVSLYPTAKDWNGKVVIWVDARGKEVLFSGEGLAPQVRRLVNAGFSVLSADLFMQGEFLENGQILREQRVVKNPREFAGYTFGYNDTLFVRRVHDVMSLVGFARDENHGANEVYLVGTGEAGILAAAARAIAGKKIDRLAVDTRGFRFTSLDTYKDPRFVPGAVKYGDTPGLLALSAPHPIWIAGEGNKTPSLTHAAYRALGEIKNVSRMRVTKGSNTNEVLVDWLQQE